MNKIKWSSGRNWVEAEKEEIDQCRRGKKENEVKLLRQSISVEIQKGISA